MKNFIKRIWAIVFAWKVPTASDEEMKYADCIITHEFGDQHTVSATTEQMVKLGVQLAKRYGLPLITQFPGDTVALREGVVPYMVITKHAQGKYLDTEEVNRQLSVEAFRLKWKRVIAITHPDHAWRVGQNLRYHRLIPLFPDLSTITYDEHCSRKTVRDRQHFIPWEIAARVFYYCKGYLYS